jgi:predicted ATPase
VAGGNALAPQPAHRELLRYELRGATRERMLRELAAAIETLTAGITLLLVLEDLHWSDHATLDLLAMLARRREPVRLFLVGTYRPVEAILRGHPLLSVKQDLIVHGRCVELPLAPPRATAVAQYLTARFPGLRVSEELAQSIYQRTDGNPLFLISKGTAGPLTAFHRHGGPLNIALQAPLCRLRVSVITPDSAPFCGMTQ